MPVLDMTKKTTSRNRLGAVASLRFLGPMGFKGLWPQDGIYLAGYERYSEFASEVVPKRQAAEHHTHAARYHKGAAKHHEGGHHKKAAHHQHTASGHGHHATYHAEEASKAHMEDHGKK